MSKALMNRIERLNIQTTPQQQKIIFLSVATDAEVIGAKSFNINLNLNWERNQAETVEEFQSRIEADLSDSPTAPNVTVIQLEYSDASQTE